MLNQEILQLAGVLAGQLDQYRQAANLVVQLNVLKTQSDFRGMLTLLKQNTGLGFLIEKYRDVDRMSLNQQASGVRTALDRSLWAEAEAGLQRLQSHLSSRGAICL